MPPPPTAERKSEEPEVRLQARSPSSLYRQIAEAGHAHLTWELFFSPRLCVSVSEALLVSWGVCERGGLGGDSTRSPFHQDTQTPTQGRASQGRKHSHQPWGDQGRRVTAGPPPPPASSAELRCLAAAGGSGPHPGRPAEPCRGAHARPPVAVRALGAAPSGFVLRVQQYFFHVAVINRNGIGNTAPTPVTAEV